MPTTTTTIIIIIIIIIIMIVIAIGIIIIIIIIITHGRHQSRELDEFFLAFHVFAKVANNFLTFFAACAHTA